MSLSIDDDDDFFDILEYCLRRVQDFRQAPPTSTDRRSAATLDRVRQLSSRLVTDVAAWLPLHEPLPPQDLDARQSPRLLSSPVASIRPLEAEPQTPPELEPQPDVEHPSEPGPHPEPEPARKKQRTASGVPNAVITRVQTLLLHWNQTPYDEHDLLLLVAPNHAASTSRQAEDLAFARLLRGFCGPSGPNQSAQWDAIYQRLVNSRSHAWGEYRLISARVDNVLDRADRLAQRHKLIAEANQSLDVHAYPRALEVKIEILKFALDWRSNLSQTQKTQFFHRRFAQIHFPSLATLPHSQLKSLIAKHHPADYEEWRRRLEPEITSRNRVASLYLAFGTGVLLDPTWNTASTQSKTLGPTITSLLSHLHSLSVADDQTPAGVLRHNDSMTRACLFATVARLGSPELHAHLQTFLSDHPPSFAAVQDPL